MEEASEKAFDENSIEDFVTSVSTFTSKANFGTETGEYSDSTNTFDDFDDFDGYAATITNMPSAIFDVSCTVNYVNPDVTGFVTTSNSWHKQLIVKVTSPSMVDTIQMTKIFSYWKFP